MHRLLCRSTLYRTARSSYSMLLTITGLAGLPLAVTPALHAQVNAQTDAHAGPAPAVSPASANPTDPPSIIGYGTTAAAREHDLEGRLPTLISAARADSLSRELSKEPHMAGTPAQARTRDVVARVFRAAGMTPEIQTYSVYMPHPTSVGLYRVSPLPREIALAEGPVAEDTTSFASPQVLTFNGYGAAGDATGDVVYVNYGLVEDYKTLDSLGISVAGKIAIARYGKSYRGIKAREAEKHGAVALIIYSDPAEDGYMVGDMYPEGPMRPMHGVQRGSVYNDNGDPTTPDYPSLPGAKRIPLAQTSLPRIPVIPVSAQSAAELLRDVRSTVSLPDGWQGGLPFRYHVGPGPVRARVVVTTDAATHPYKDVWNVLGVVRGSEFPDEVVIVGAHRDAWGPGASDNVSGTVSVLEAARAVSTLARQGHPPKRTIVFASWDGEEWGLLGSAEYVEQDTTRLTKFGIAYFNQDMSAFGPDFDASGSPSLRAMLRDVTKTVHSPARPASVYTVWRSQKPPINALVNARPVEPEISDPGGGSDYAGFYNHLGIPIMEWGFGGHQGVYHSAYDSYHWIAKFGDPGFRYHATTAQITAMMALRIANAEILPYDYVEYAQVMRGHATAIAQSIGERRWNVSTSTLLAAITHMEEAARTFDAARDSALQRPLPMDTRKRANALLLQVERAFVRSQGLYGRSWYRNVIYAADNDNGYSTIVLPSVNEAVQAGDRQRTVREIADLTERFERATQILIYAAQSLR